MKESEIIVYESLIIETKTKKYKCSIMKTLICRENLTGFVVNNTNKISSVNFEFKICIRLFL